MFKTPEAMAMAQDFSPAALLEIAEACEKRAGWLDQSRDAIEKSNGGNLQRRWRLKNDSRTYNELAQSLRDLLTIAQSDPMGRNL